MLRCKEKLICGVCGALSRQKKKKSVVFKFPIKKKEYFMQNFQYSAFQHCYCVLETLTTGQKDELTNRQSEPETSLWGSGGASQ